MSWSRPIVEDPPFPPLPPVRLGIGTKGRPREVCNPRDAPDRPSFMYIREEQDRAYEKEPGVEQLPIGGLLVTRPMNFYRVLKGRRVIQTHFTVTEHQTFRDAVYRAQVVLNGVPYETIIFSGN